MARGTTDKSTNVIGVALIAAVAGAVAALLMAPKSGKELRGDIKDKANKAKDATKDKMNQARDKAADVASKAKDTVKEAADKGEDRTRSRLNR